MLTIHVWPRWVKEFLLTHPLYKSPPQAARPESAPYKNNLIYRVKVDVCLDLPGGKGEKRTDERFGTSLKWCQFPLSSESPV